MAIVGEIEITNSVNGASAKPTEVGWAFDMVESLEITYSNSLMQNMFIRGETLRDYSLLCCCSERERQDMLKAAGQMTASGAGNDVVSHYNFALPLSFLNHTVGSLRNSWPVDGSVLAGPIQISVNWRTFAYGFVATAANWIAGGAPTTFKFLELTAKTTQLQDASFSVKKAMMLDPQLVYSLPARYITSVDYTKVVTNAIDEFTLNLASAPSGMLEGILISIRPKVGTIWTDPGANGTNNIIGGSASLERIVLEFGGQNLFRTDTYEQYQHFMRSTFGDTLEYTGVIHTQGAALVPATGVGTETYRHCVYFIPLVNDACKVFREHTNENLPSYGGSQLQLTLRANRGQVYQAANYAQRVKLSPDATSLDGVDAENIAPVTTWQIWIGYIVSGLVEISQGTVDLQL
jgi:hypothetical protein